MIFKRRMIAVERGVVILYAVVQSLRIWKDWHLVKNFPPLFYKMEEKKKKNYVFYLIKNRGMKDFLKDIF